VEINDKDLKDAMLLLLAGEIGETDDAAINLRYLAKRMSDDWGFYYTSTTNLGRIKDSHGRRRCTDRRYAQLSLKEPTACWQPSRMSPNPGNGSCAPKPGRSKSGTRKSMTWGESQPNKNSDTSTLTLS
jgi:hypothetical protein